MARHQYAHAASQTVDRHTARNITLVVLAVLILLVGITAVFGVRFYKQAKEVKAHESQAIASLSIINDTSKLKDADASQTAIKQAQQETAQAKTIAHGSLWNIATKMPYFGSDIATVQGMTEIIDDLARQTLPSLVNEVQQLSNADLSGSEGQLNLQPISDAQSNFDKLNQQVQAQNKKYNNLAEPKITMVKNAYLQGKEQFNKISDLIGQVSNATHMLPVFLGQNGARTYLLVAQTTSEQRSGGGLVGSLGTMTAEGGKISVGDFHPNAEFINGDNGTAEEHAIFNRPLGFSFDVRDTFAVPDIARNAEMLNATWQRSQYACNIDGLISVDPVFIQKMVEINGPVTLANGTVLTGENTAEYMLNTIYKEVPDSQQDEYFEYIAKTVMDGAFDNMTVDKMVKVAQAIGDLAENRHFYAYTFHADEAQYFQGAGLAKGVPSSETDPEVGIYINEQNPSKLGWYIDRTSEVTKTGDKTYHVKYTLTNRLTSAEMATCTDYILGGVQHGVSGQPVAASGTSAQRVLLYAPAGGRISNISTTGKVNDQGNATMDGKSLNYSMAYIAPGKSVTYEFDVTTSSKAATDLKIDQTPCGKMENTVTYNY